MYIHAMYVPGSIIQDNECGTLNKVTYCWKRLERKRKKERKKGREREREKEKGLRDRELCQYMYIHTMYVHGSIIDNKCGTLNKVTYSWKRREREREKATNPNEIRVRSTLG